MNGSSGDSHFAFLAQVKPASLHNLLRRMEDGDAAMALAHLPPLLTAQTMAYYPENKQASLMGKMRLARRAEPAAAAGTAERIQRLLESLKTGSPAPPEKTGDAGLPAPPAAGAPPAPLSPRGSAASAYGKSALKDAQPKPWKPRVTDATPINVPARPGSPPPVSGPPSKSPLSKLNVFELLGLSRKEGKSIPPKRPSVRPAEAKPPVPQRGAASSRPPAREGTVGSGLVKTSDKARLLGAGKTPVLPKRPAPPAAGRRPGGAKKIDGMAILAAILREAPMDVRQNVQTDNPALFKALKERMFVFDDLHFSDQAALAQVFTVAPIHAAALALRFASPKLRERALAAVSPRRAEMIRQEERSAQSGTSGLDDIETAQRQVLDVALRLQSAGRIVIDPRDPDLAG